MTNLVTGRCIPEQYVPERSIWDFLSLGQCVPCMMRPLDDASLGRCIPWSTRPLDDASLRYVSPNDVSRPFWPEDCPYTGEVRLACRDIAGHTLHCQASLGKVR
jgi:hypothetical protein